MLKIDADPTKDFFISMLTRDISLLSSIIDLVDNSVDAAISSEGYEGKCVELMLSNDSFEIIDNCGGISRSAAEEYAFKFGRPASAPLTPHTVGRFGVGMKRALFKIGSNFTVESHHKLSSFQVQVDVNEWLAEDGSWKFDLDEINSNGAHLGTKIVVGELHGSIAEKFSDTVFISSLIDALSDAHYKILKEGFVIKVNGENVGLKDIEILTSETLGVAGVEIQLGDVKVSIKAGVGERDFHAGGWYVLCNNRLIEGAHKGILTGWGQDGIRSYHPDLAFFRGVVEFYSEDGGDLPWNTTKTGIDNDNPVFRTALGEMKRIMRKVIELLKDRVKEQENLDQNRINEGPINAAIEGAEKKSIFDVTISDDFVRPDAVTVQREITHRRISYNVRDEDLTVVKESLGATTNKQVGESTFAYYYENEC
jgi:hypothetical protein